MKEKPSNQPPHSTNPFQNQHHMEKAHSPGVHNRGHHLNQGAQHHHSSKAHHHKKPKKGSSFNQRKTRGNFAAIIKKNRRSLILISLIVLISFFFLHFKYLFVFLIVAFVAGLLNYFIHASGVHIHLGHVSFLSVIFTVAVDFKFGILMIILAHIIPEILSGHFDQEMIITSGVYFFINVIAAFAITDTNVVVLGYILTTLQLIIAASLGFMAGTPITELATEDGVEFVLNLFYYTNFAVPLLGLIN